MSKRVMFRLQNKPSLQQTIVGEGCTLPVTDEEVSPESLPLQLVPEFFVENVYPVSEFSFILGFFAFDEAGDLLCKIVSSQKLCPDVEQEYSFVSFFESQNGLPEP